MRRFTSRSLIFDAAVTRRVTEERTNSRDILHVFVRNATNVVSQVGKWDDILRKKLLISYIDQFVVPAKLQCILRDP